VSFCINYCDTGKLVGYSPELKVETWTLHEFWEPNHPAAPPTVIPFADIRCQLCRGIVNTTNPPMWVTTSLDRVSTIKS
jgi:hypothetical protein